MVAKGSLKFQFHKGTIRTGVGSPCMSEFMRDFNSIKVRLELQSSFLARLLIRFQFHKGTIRTVEYCHYFISEIEFQFHKGTIRTLCCSNKAQKVATFQFHKGTIRTLTVAMTMRWRICISIP